LAGANTAQTATLKATPRISIKYNFNDNLYGVDPGFVNDPSSASYMDYLVGLVLNAREGQHTFELSGDAGYEQYLAIGGFSPDVQPQDLDFITISGGLLYRFAGRRVIFEASDRISRTRDLSEVFGNGTDAIGYWSLFTNNVASLGLKYSPSPKSRIELHYFYDALLFDNSKFSQLEPVDSAEHRLLGRSEYDFTGKTTGILDIQYANRTFTEVNYEKAADFNMLQGLLGLRYNFRERTYVEALGGYAMRDFYNLSDQTLPSPPFAPDRLMFDVEDMGDAIGQIRFVSSSPKRYQFEASVDRGISIYGNNLFFTYTSAGANGTLYITPKLSTKLSAVYRQTEYGLDVNGREWLWTEDRVDNILTAQAALHWDILQKGGQGTLMAEIGYSYQLRDSNIDDPSDYEPLSMQFWSYDSVINVYYAQIQVLPTILIGNQ
jgi:hypothetical protein